MSRTQGRHHFRWPVQRLGHTRCTADEYKQADFRPCALLCRLVHLDIKGQDEASLAAHMARLADARNVMYIVRATVENMQAIALQVKSRIAAANK